MESDHAVMNALAFGAGEVIRLWFNTFYEV